MIAIVFTIGVVVLLFFARRLFLSGNDIMRQWGGQIRSASRKTGVPVPLLIAQMENESGGDPDVPGKAGEVGLMQIKPIFQKDLFRLGLSPRQVPSWDPAENVMDAAAGLADLKKKTGSWRDALRSYNCCGWNIDRALNDPWRSAGYADSIIQRARELGWTGKAT